MRIDIANCHKSHPHPDLPQNQNNVTNQTHASTSTVNSTKTEMKNHFSAKSINEVNEQLLELGTIYMKQQQITQDTKVQYLL